MKKKIYMKLKRLKLESRIYNFTFLLYWERHRDKPNVKEILPPKKESHLPFKNHPNVLHFPSEVILIH